MIKNDLFYTPTTLVVATVCVGLEGGMDHFT